MTMERLIGRWEGTGEGGFPTMESFTYREVLEVSATGGGLHYRQTTWRQRDEDEVVSHLETGFIFEDEDGGVLVLNAQGRDRVEVLRGRVELDGGSLIAELESTALAHDERMISAWRRLRVDGDSLDYEMGMATTAVPDGADHLSGHLERTRS